MVKAEQCIKFLYQRCQTFYEFDRKYPKRSTNFGYGTKYDFTKEYFFI